MLKATARLSHSPPPSVQRERRHRLGSAREYSESHCSSMCREGGKKREAEGGKNPTLSESCQTPFEWDEQSRCRSEMPKRLPFLCALGAYKLLRRAFVSLLFSWQVVPRQNSAFSLSRALLPAVRRSPLLASPCAPARGLPEPPVPSAAFPRPRGAPGLSSRARRGVLGMRVY